MSDVTPTPAAGEPTVSDLQAEVVAAREDLVASIAALKAETQPKALLERGGRNIAGIFTDEFGGIRPERVAIAGAVVAGIVVIALLRRRR
jgi:hypothetical protein